MFGGRADPPGRLCAPADSLAATGGATSKWRKTKPKEAGEGGEEPYLKRGRKGEGRTLWGQKGGKRGKRGQKGRGRKSPKVKVSGVNTAAHQLHQLTPVLRNSVHKNLRKSRDYS